MARLIGKKEGFGRWLLLFFEYLKRDFIKICIWVLCLGLFASGLVSTFEELAKGEGLYGMFITLENPAMIAIIGPTPVKTVADYTLGAMYAHEMLLFCCLFSMTISMLHIIAHTRKEEDSGLAEMVRSFKIGRKANSLAMLVETIFVNFLLTVLISLVLIGSRANTISIEGSLLFGLSVGMAGILGATIALLMAEIMPAASSAIGSSLGIMGALYIIRGASDIAMPKLSMLNPLGWTYLSYPFTENRWLFIILPIALSMLQAWLALFLEGRRDLGASFFLAKEGREKADKTLLSVPGLFFRLNRGTITAWLISFFVLSISYGAIYGDMGDFLEGNDLLKQMFTVSGVSIEKSFTSTLMIVIVGLVIILPVTIINRVFTEEKNRHLSLVFSTKVKRSHVFWTNIILAIFAALFGILLSVLPLAGTALSVMENTNMGMGDFLAIGFNLWPSAMFFIGLGAFLLGWMPGLTKGLYFYLAYSFLLDYFQTLLNLPKWLLKTTPQSWLAKMPIESFNLKAFVLLSLLSLAFILAGSIGYKRRDLYEQG